MCRVSSPHLILCNNSLILKQSKCSPLMSLDDRKVIWFTFGRESSGLV